MARIINSKISGKVVCTICLFILAGLTSSGLQIKAKLPAIRSSKNTTQQLVRQIYSSQIGIREKGTNAGAAVEQYLRYVNLPKGNPWCTAFVCWVFGQAGVENPRTGWSPDLFPDKKVIWRRGEKLTAVSEWTVDSGKLTMESVRRAAYIPGLSSGFRPPTSDLRPQSSNLCPSPGDVFGLYFPEKKRIAHVGFVDQWDGTWMISVEGNTNNSGSREGDGVYRKRRLVRGVYCVVRYVKNEK